ncbi:hypothetical protein [Salinarimonas soli]|uniref:Antifreeze protein n=1 Tax=Salinarimonas soli TaxID=1638099 RepID=A0A5B2VBJ0_9HYPH|nr:hypothetical protein [Salinarimonas soli]KAA2236451.1 hypothetical protein F0L46_15020 [Salinarimonas soli]
MKRILTGPGAAAVTAFIILGAPVASAAPFIAGHGLAARDPALVQAQYIERRERVIRRGPVYRGGPRYIERRVVRPRRQFCRVEVVRRMTPRGMIVERVRRCR